MKIKWWGHASFLITDNRGVKIITDPYGEELPYQRINDEADIVTISHDHYDHNAVGVVKGRPEVIKTTGNFIIKDIKITGIPTNHDKSGGKERGDNIIFLFELNGKRIAHLGDLGHLLDDEKLDQLKGVDILIIPVGGTYTINAEEAFSICREIDPEIIIPMHYKTPILDFTITGVDDFTRNFAKEAIYRAEALEVEVEDIPAGKKVLLLDYVR